ncbi:MAG: hypothetical protein A2Y62_10400 [Candidatus Fischerbacteria bacterium RBG_13_37_8]|uniref:DUF3368 domain-containing protein n=1 Tax=Candidatus Fischerbacteria bacterium RBG_13_37_8 TaxID=1817863 RepID=A0A1F5VQQ8_9BACT|nr:MAG: hypothetical protein A2Y62_10400 [Candidatus Fischerbacteria bacterium RBG_13_37_8]
MPGKKSQIIINTSPWIALTLCNQLDILPHMYSIIYMPEAVKREILAGGKLSVGAKELRAKRWVKIAKIKDSNKITLLHELDQGEAEVIILAKEKGIDTVLIDEKIARMQAKILGLNVIGTIGLLLKAKNKGIITSIKPSIEQMMQNGIWIREEIFKGILKSAKE